MVRVGVKVGLGSGLGVGLEVGLNVLGLSLVAAVQAIDVAARGLVSQARSEIGDGGRLLARAREAVAGTPVAGSFPGAPRLPKFVIRNPRGSSAATLDGVLLSTLRITS